MKRYVHIREMIEYVTSNNVTQFADLMNYARVEHFEDWYPLLKRSRNSCAYVMGQYIKSVRNRSLAVLNSAR